MENKLLQDLKQKLEAEKKSVQKELESFAVQDQNLGHNWDTKYPNREDGDKDDEADEVQEYDNKLSVEYSLELKLKGIKEALEKIAQGQYGKCAKCGNNIEEDRLIAAPSAKLCVRCNNK